MTKKSSKKRGLAFCYVSFGLSLGVFFFLLLTMLATGSHLISYDLGFHTITLKYGPDAALVALGISLASLLISLFRDPKVCGFWALSAVLISGGMVGGFYAYTKALQAFPPINQVATNWERPLDFSNDMMKRRGSGAVKILDDPYVSRTESLVWGGRRISEINLSTCPGAVTLVKKSLNAEQIVQILKDQELTVTGRSDWRVEATKKDWLYGFKYDVVVRIDPQSIDIRSVSRQDIPDLGANCRLVSALVREFRNAQG